MAAFSSGFVARRVTRATVSPPTATHPAEVGHDNALSASGMYADDAEANVAPPSRLSATAPVATAGCPLHLVPTSAQTRADGHAIPKTSSTGNVITPPEALVVADVDVVDVVDEGLAPVVVQV